MTQKNMLLKKLYENGMFNTSARVVISLSKKSVIDKINIYIYLTFLRYHFLLLLNSMYKKYYFMKNIKKCVIKLS